MGDDQIRFILHESHLFQDLQKGTGFWISLAEKEEIEGIPVGKDHKRLAWV